MNVRARKAVPGRAALRAGVLAVLALPPLASVVTLARVFGSRVDFPMDLQSMEGGSLYEAYRILHGMSLYGPPGDGFVPYGYPPGHPLLLAALGVVRLDYATGRGLSIVCLVAATALLARAVACASERPRWLLAVFVAGATAAAFPVGGSWYDFVRNDELAILLPVGAAFAADRGELSRRRLAGIAALLVAGVFTRQTDVFFVAPVVGVALVRSRRAALELSAMTLALALVALAAAELASHGWFLRTVVGIMARHGRDGERAFEGVGLCARFYPPLVLTLLLAGALWKGDRLSRAGGLWTGMLLAAIPASVLPYAKAGGYRNDLIPVLVLAVPASLVVLADVLRVATSPGQRRALQGAALVAFDAWLVVVAFDPRPYMPTPRQRANAEQFDRDLAALPGGVVIPYHPFVAATYGHTPEQLLSCGLRDARDAGWSIDLRGWYARVDPRWVIEDLGWTDVTDDYGFARYLTDPPEIILETLWGPTALLEKRSWLEGANPEERVLFDFDSGGYAGWTQSGDAFGAGPARAGGHLVATSFDPASGDAATGSLTSPAFLVAGDHLGLLVAGGNRHETRVELVVAGVAARLATGGKTDDLREVTWETSALRGETARVRLVDEDAAPWGHIVVGRVTQW